MTQTISARIVATEARLASLRAKRGAAVLDDADFDALEYANAEAELEALRDAETISVRREREAAGQTRTERRDEQRAKLKRLERERLAAVSEAEEAVKALVDALQRAIEANEEIHSAVHELTGRGPVGFAPISFENRLSMYLAADMRKLKQGPRGSRLGLVNWPNCPPRQHEAWAVEESKIAKADLAEALKGENA
ncbi:hypothetical protein LJR235_002376 [Pararhizobium sp. LjRoot235]|uniref:hypothetical protein n=1 Tax=Pararhizobium sp. LjRoot235 TaxID=3342291 RepID=UPI003ECF5982